MGGRQGAANPLPAGEIPPRPQKGRRGVIRPCPTVPRRLLASMPTPCGGAGRWFHPVLPTGHGPQTVEWLAVFSVLVSFSFFFFFFFVFGCLNGRPRLVVLVGTHWARFS
ncbi:hypothetical protein PVAP13_3KG460201 [Panicum virgatum]|uniref:Uncharacterized protein n=1 Tax=Panicum virgatum TaxID=38727 RepID=A0A8T0UZ52_PANVG|nr:hypothetical protein PVAP13_3KG460201 [Panicum virgatum]